MRWLSDWRDADLAERDRQDRLADWRHEMEQEAREVLRERAEQMIARQMD